jgi:hypothetical protein
MVEATAIVEGYVWPGAAVDRVLKDLESYADSLEITLGQAER